MSCFLNSYDNDYEMVQIKYKQASMCSFKMTGQHANSVLSSVTNCNKASYGNKTLGTQLTDFFIMSFN